MQLIAHIGQFGSCTREYKNDRFLLAVELLRHGKTIKTYFFYFIGTFVGHWFFSYRDLASSVVYSVEQSVTSVFVPDNIFTLDSVQQSVELFVSRQCVDLTKKYKLKRIRKSRETAIKITPFNMNVMALSFLADAITNLGNSSARICELLFWAYDFIKQCPLAPPTPKELMATIPPFHGVTLVTTFEKVF